MFVPFFLERVSEGHHDHWNHHDRENDVRKENHEIKCFYPTKFWKFRTAMMVMIEQVSNEKNARKNERRYHELLMTSFIFFLNEIIAND